MVTKAAFRAVRICVLPIALAVAGCSGSSTPHSLPDPKPKQTSIDSTLEKGSCEAGLPIPREYRPEYNRDKDNVVFKVDVGKQFIYTRFLPVEGKRTKEEADRSTATNRGNAAKRECWVAEWSFTCPHNTREFGKAVMSTLPADQAVYAPSVGSEVEDHGRFWSSECGGNVNGWTGGPDWSSVSPLGSDAFDFGSADLSLRRTAGGVEVTFPYQRWWCDFDRHDEPRDVKWQVNDGEAVHQVWVVQVSENDLRQPRCHLQVPAQHTDELLEALEQQGALHIWIRSTEEQKERQIQKCSEPAEIFFKEGSYSHRRAVQECREEANANLLFLIFNINGYDRFVAPLVDG